MNAHTDYPGMGKLFELVCKQRQQVAIQIRVSGVDRDLRKQMRTMLDEAGVEAVTCDGYEVRRAVSRDGEPTAAVTPIRQGNGS